MERSVTCLRPWVHVWVGGWVSQNAKEANLNTPAPPPVSRSKGLFSTALWAAVRLLLSVAGTLPRGGGGGTATPGRGPL